ncbi:MAG TPA: hypothetical protein VF658_16340 [Pyrinomonadaceae bacterium]
MKDAKIMTSNLQLRSNVYMRRPDLALGDDEEFIRHVRGAVAVQKLLAMLGVPPDKRRHDDPEVTRLARKGRLTLAQLNTLRWAVRCVECGCLPSGLTFRGEVAFRCDITGCALRRTPVRSVLIPDQVLQLTKHGGSFTELLERAIAECHGEPPKVRRVPPFSRVTVRVNPTADWLYSDEEMSAFLTFALLNRMTVRA